MDPITVGKMRCDVAKSILTWVRLLMPAFLKEQGG
jgi:hypothetical protein